MEKEESTAEELVGSPDPENVKDVDAPEGGDHNIDPLAKNKLSDDEMVGTPTDTNEERMEKAPDIHEEDQDVESSTMKHLLNNEVDEITTDGDLASRIHRVDQEIETSSKRHSVDGEIEDPATDMEVRGQGEDDSTHSSTSSSPIQPSNSKSSINTLTEVEDTATGMEVRGQEEGDSAHSSTSSSATQLSDSKNSINTLTEIGDTATDMEVRGQEEDDSSHSSTSASATQLSNSKNSINTLTEIGNTATDMEVRGQEEDDSTHSSTSSSPIQPSNSKNSINTLTEVGDTATGMEVRGQEEGDSAHSSTSSSATQLSDSNKLINTLTEIGDTATDMEVRGQEEDDSTHSNTSSSATHLSNSKNSINTLTEIGNTATDMEVRGQEEDDSTHSGTSSSPVQLSNYKKSINTLTGDPDIPKVGHENDNCINDTMLDSTATDIEIRGQEEDNATDNSTSSSENSVDDDHTGEPDIQKENQEEDNSTNKPTVSSTSEEGEILDYMKDKGDREPSSEMITVNHQSGEKIEMEMDHVQEESEDEASMHMKPKDVSHATSVEDGEKIGDDFNDRQGITETSSSEQTEDIITDAKDNTSSKEEEGSIRDGIQEPEVEVNSAAWPGKAAALTKFVKLKGLLAVSNVIRRLSRRVDEHSNDPDDQDRDINNKNKNIKEVNSSEKSQLVGQTTLGKRRWRALRFIGMSLEKDQGNKAELKEVALESLESIAMKGRVVLYTRLWCQDCKEARLFLRKRRLRYSEINIDVYPGRKLELEKITGSSDVPAVFFNQVLIGGLRELKALDESGQLKEKIEFVTTEGPSPKAPLPPFSGEDDVSSTGVVDELAVIVRNMKDTIVVKDRFYKFRRITNCFLGSEAVDFLTEDQYLEREEAIEFARKLSKELFFRHVLDENTFEDGNHLYRFLDQDPVISQCQNIPRGIIQLKRQPVVQLSYRLKCLLYAIIDAYTSEDGKRVDYRTIHGSEEFARYLRIAEELQRVELDRMAKEERLAFFINLYNLMAIHAILVWGHPEGALDRRRLLNDFKYVIGGCAYSLSDIHNGILRSNQRPPYTLVRPFGITDKRFKVSLPYPEPLIHFALVSGNQSAPPLRCYSPKNIDLELSQAARDFLQSGAFILHLDSRTVSVTKILKWYSVDFGKNEVEVLKHASNYLEVEKTRTLLELLDSTQLKVVYQPYDWRLNS